MNRLNLFNLHLSNGTLFPFTSIICDASFRHFLLAVLFLSLSFLRSFFSPAATGMEEPGDSEAASAEGAMHADAAARALEAVVRHNEGAVAACRAAITALHQQYAVENGRLEQLLLAEQRVGRRHARAPTHKA